ncbi:uncharacterized protein LOC130680027 isoform X5 [Manis pentadactyla]|uniref:uncharacterized protein LOC130680027 isoform X5 n=1 Tax=Manis pentadactyla TaxID=143292 RepID=UPI00255CC676|nr:uncharacterized protein LOC130680027 isoform X5 [Manis pentadactyla]
MVDRRCARLRLPPGAQAPVAPAIGPDMEPPPRPALRSSSSAASSLAPSYLLRSVQSGPRFRGEGDSDGSVGRKPLILGSAERESLESKCSCRGMPALPQFPNVSMEHRRTAP